MAGTAAATAEAVAIEAMAAVAAVAATATVATEEALSSKFSRTVSTVNFERSVYRFFFLSTYRTSAVYVYVMAPLFSPQSPQ